jgi:phosphatidate cytidylyltransferase
MGTFHWYVLRGYLGFLVLAALLTLLDRPKKSGPQSGSVQQKSLTYILISVAFLTVTWLPQRWHLLTMLLMLVGALASWELARALRLSGQIQIGLALICASLIGCSDFLPPKDLVEFWSAALLLAVVLTTLAMPQDDLGRYLSGIMGSIVYVPFSLASYVWVWHTDPAGFYATILFLCIAANDTFAQVTGKLIGKHPLAVEISPTKTVEGAFGGILFATLAGLGLGSTLGWSLAHSALIGSLIGLAGLAGDLSESKWKRALGIKDFSTLLGANGGVLDRFDALIFAAPIFYLIIRL